MPIHTLGSIASAPRPPPAKNKISIYLSPSLVKYLNRKKQPNRNFNISAQRTLIGKYKLNTHDYLKLNKAKTKVISKLCY